MRRHMERLELLFRNAVSMEDFGGARVYAAIYIQSTPIAVGFNNDKSSPFARNYKHRDGADFFHAETHVIKQAYALMGYENFKDARTTLYVARAKKTHPGGKWVWGIAKPCIGCQQAIKDYQINRVIFTLDEDDVKCYGQY